MSLLLIKNKIGIPPDWKLIPIGNILISSQYGTSNSNSETGVPVVGMKNLQDGKVNFNALPLVSVSNEEKKRLLLHDGDILLNRTNSYDLVGKIGFVDKAIEAVFASYLVRLQVDRKKSDAKFVTLWLTSFWADQMIKKIATRAVSQANVNPTEFKKFCLVPIPPLPEQKAIADLLSTWDEAIEKTERLIQAKEKQFKWLLRKLISEPAHKKGNTEWKKVKIGSLLTESRIPDRKNNPKKRLSVKLHLKGVEVRDYRGTESKKGTTYFLRKAGQFIYGKQNIFRGSVGLIPKELDGYSSTQDIPAFDINDSVDKKWLLFLFAYPNFYKKLELYASGSGSKRLHPKELFKISIMLPSLEDQHNIAKTLSSAQHEIDLLKQLVEKYQTQKRGLMQKILTGQWRVKPEIVNQYMEV